MNLKFASIAALLVAGVAMAAEPLPKATELVSKMGFGYNIGNTLEAPNGPTSWGNEFPTQELIDSVKAAGFNTVRIPCAWYTHADTSTNTINSGWLDSVKTVVDFVVNKGMYAILNIHWDSGWMEENIGESVDDNLNKRQAAFWKQIAEKFASYDEHLLFASMNEPGMNTTDFTAARTTVLNTYHETMMKTVRETGGNNATRTLIVQAPYTDEAKMLKWWKNNLPSDPAGSGYMMGEFHFYPYQFSLMDKDESWGKQFYYWGEENFSSTDTERNTPKGAYASPEYVDSVFKEIKESFDIPFVIGEFGAIKRLGLTGENLRLHLQSRAAFYGKVATLSKKYGFIPVVWDTGAENNGNMTIIRRNKNRGILDYECLNALRQAFGLTAFEGNSIDALVNQSVSSDDKALHVSFASTRTDSAATATIRLNINNEDWSKYKGISFDLKLNGKTNGTVEGNEYEWSSVTLFNMSGNWKWEQAVLGNFEDFDAEGKRYTISFDGSSSSNMNFNDITKVVAIGINIQGTQISGEVYLDNMLLLKADGTVDTLQNFNKQMPDIEGIGVGELVNTVFSTTETDPKQKEDPKKENIAIQKQGSATNHLFVRTLPGAVQAVFTTANSGRTSAKLMNSLGQVIAAQDFNAKSGANAIQLATSFHGPAFLIVKQGSQQYTAKVLLR
ncbi:MAG: glycoside hydrolase family 5 protein [Fibrobacter sp.]|nr:glycoside hydrolase family 5 protein [Fibrobacter sp.]